jgi:hypothetical protein
MAPFGDVLSEIDVRLFDTMPVMVRRIDGRSVVERKR